MLRTEEMKAEAGKEVEAVRLFCLTLWGGGRILGVQVWIVVYVRVRHSLNVVNGDEV